MTTGSFQARPLNEAEIDQALVDLPGWAHADRALVKVVDFPTFDDAICFMMHAAGEADVLDHHPEWTNCNRRVQIRLTTHAAGGAVTRLDLVLARRMQSLLPDADA
jgi:4a-hydroxytetrahydrobiopterin dehydratase